MTFKKVTFDLTDPVDQTTSQTADLGYASNVDRRSILKDPRFLKDLQDSYDPLQQLSDEDLINKFYSDENWAQLNTVGAVGRMMEGGGDTDEEKMRNARLTAVWDNLPNFYQEGGRGWGAVPDIAKSVLLDPLNLIGGVAAKGVSQGAMRTSTALGKSAPVKSFLKGVTAGAATEGAISGGQEALINVSEQGYRQDIGLQQEFDWNQFAQATAFGTALGGAVGGAIGIPSAIGGVRQGRADVEAGQFLGTSAEDMANMTNKQARQMRADASSATGPFMPEDVARARADQPEEVAPEVFDEAPKTSTEEILGELDGQQPVFEQQLNEARKAQEAIVEDGLENTTLGREIAKDVERAEINKNIIARLKNEQDQITYAHGENNKVTDQTVARGMQKALDADVAHARVAIKKGDTVTAEAILASAQKRAKKLDEQAKKASAKKARGKGKGSASTTTDEAELATEDGSGPSSTDDSSVTTEDIEADEARVADLRENNPDGYKKEMTAVVDTLTSGDPDANKIKRKLKKAKTPDEVDSIIDEVSEGLKTKVADPDEASAPKLPEVNWGGKAGQGGQKSVDEQLAKAGFTPEQADQWLKENIANGNIATNEKGVIKLGKQGATKTVRQLLKDTEAPAVKFEGETSVSEEIAKIAEDNRKVTDPEKLAEIIKAQAKRNLPSKSQEEIDSVYDALMSGGEKQRLADDQTILKAKIYDSEKKDFIKAIRDLQKNEADYKKDLTEEELANYEPPSMEQMQINAKKVVIAQRAETGTIKSPRNVTNAIERASILEGAGRTENGKIQSFLKWNSRRVGLDRTEQTFVDNRMFDMGTALAEASKLKSRKGEHAEKLIKWLDKQDIEKLRARIETAKSPKQIEDLEKRIAKIESTQDELAKIESESLLVPFQATKSTPNVIKEITEGPNKGRVDFKHTAKKGEILYANGRDGKIYADEATAELVSQKKPSLVSEVLEKNPAVKGNKLLFIKKKDGTGKLPYRLASKKQAETGEGIKSLLGKQNPDDWEVRYIEESKVPTGSRSNINALAKLWDEAGEEPNASDGQGVIRFVGDETGNGMATPLENLAESPLDVSKLNEQQRTAFNRRNKRGDLGEAYLSDVQHAIDSIDNGEFPTKGNKTELAILISDLEQLYSIQRDLIPGGIVRKAGDREKIINNIEKIMQDADPEVAVVVKNTLAFIGGDPLKAPRIVTTEGGDQGWSYANGNIRMGDREKVSADHTFFHAVAQWSYDNILTPEDRMLFWNALSRDIATKGRAKAKIPVLDRYAETETGLARKIWADQFASWAFDNRSHGIFSDHKTNVYNEHYWQRMSKIQRASVDRYFSGANIAPELEGLFSKVLPEQVRSIKKIGVISDDPKTKKGMVVKGFQVRLEMAVEEIQRAIRVYQDPEGNPEELVNAARGFRDLLASAFPNRDVGSKPTAMKNTLSWLRPLDKVARGRFADLNYIMADKGGLIQQLRAKQDELGQIRDDALQEADSPEAIELKAKYIEELFEHGHADLLKGGSNARPYGGEQTSYTTLNELIRLMREYSDNAYKKEEGASRADEFVNLRTGMVSRKPSFEIRTREGRKIKVENRAADKDADAVTKTPANKRNSAKNKKPKMDHVTEATQRSYGDRSVPELREIYKKNKDTQLGDQVAWLMWQKKNAEPEPIYIKEGGEAPTNMWKTTKELRKLQKNELVELWKNGAETGQFTHGNIEWPIHAVEWEIHRRGITDTYKKLDKPVPKYLRQRIRTELSNGVGIATEDGIPPSAPISTKTILSYMSHRDPEVQYTMRTMLHRMMNLMGKNVENTLGETNVMDGSDIARLAKVDPVGMKNVSVDFRSDTFNKLRSDLRKISIGLTKGNSNPFDAVHEIGHTMVRGGMLPKEEMDAVIELYRAADDTIKSNVEKSYGKKYPDMTPAQLEEVLAEEWFAEGMANYLGQRVMRGDVMKSMLSGSMDNIRLKNSFERAVDRMVEYISYVVNGLIGRKDIKQQFRRLTIYGDMLEASNKSPLARVDVKEPAVSPTYVTAYAHDIIRQSKDSKKAAISKYTANGKYSVNDDGTPTIYYHGTPNGTPFKDSQVVMRQGGGMMGSGIYISPSSRAVEGTYARRPTQSAVRRMIDDGDFDEKTKDDLIWQNERLHSDREKIASERRRLADVQNEVETHNDTVERLRNALDEDDLADLNVELRSITQRRKQIQDNLDHLLYSEKMSMKILDDAGLNFEPTVLPLITRMKNTFDLGKNIWRVGDDGNGINYSNTHNVGREDTNAALSAIMRVTNNFEGGNMADFQKAVEENFGASRTGVAGQIAYNSYIKTIMRGDSSLTEEQAKEIFREALEDAGYDSMRAPHRNRINKDNISDSDDYRAGEEVDYDAFVIFNPENVKHVNAEFFDAEDARLYYRDFEGSAKGFNGGAAMAMADGQTSKLDTTNTVDMLQAVEDEGVSPPMVDAMSSIIRQRDFTPVQEQAVRKQGPFAWLQAQSTRMESMGMNWLGGWYKQHFPDQHQTFASKYMPIHNMLRGLPGADGKVRAWARSASGSVWQEQPQAYRKIVSALRHGADSRQAKALTPSERVVFDKIKDEFAREHARMNEAGMQYVGWRKNYLPQIWSRDKIQKNREEFLEGMMEYYFQEQIQLGNVLQKDDARQFAEKVYQSLTRESIDGVQVPESPKSPIRGSTKNPQAESIDFNRLIELEKYPRAMEIMEKFLEDDLEFMLVKYFEGSTRRILHTKKFGLNSHGVDDYLYTTENGARGIAKLLSTNKVFNKDFRSVTTDGVQEGTLRSEVSMPFTGKDQDAIKFSEELVEVANTQGIPAAREMLNSIAIRTPNGQIDKTYIARTEAILGALQDHKGVKTLLENDNAKFIENAMRVSRKDSLNDFGGKAGLRVSRGLRSFNNVTLLAFTMLTSLGDLALPVIRSGSMTDWIKGVKTLALDPDYKRALSEVGVAMENITHERMLNMYGAVDSKLSNAFFNATMLTPWTDFNRQIASALAHQTFITHQKKALRSYVKGKPVSEQPREYKISYRYMKNFGLEDYLEGGSKSRTTLSDRSLLAKDESLRKALIRFADESIFQPNANDAPLFAQTPLGALAFQLKSFPLMMSRLAGHVLREAKIGKLLKGDASESNVKPLLYFLSLGPTFGMGALAVKDIVQMRGGEDEQSPELRVRNALKTAGYDEKIHGNEVDFLGWYLEGMLQMGGVGLLGDILHSAVTQADNGSYGQTRFLQTLGGPSVGLITAGLSVLGGGMDSAFGSSESNAKERTAVREIATRIPVVGGIKRAREGIVNSVAGEPTGNNSSGWGSWGGKWS